jgi:hypothetical protein
VSGAAACAATGRATGVATGSAGLAAAGDSPTAWTCSALAISPWATSAVAVTLARRHTRLNTTTWSFSANGAMRHQVDGSPR